MPKTWGDIQNETLQLMFSYTLNGVNIAKNPENLDYNAAMTAAANYALRDLAASAAPIVRRLSLSLNPIPNMLGDGAGAFRVTQSLGNDVCFSASRPMSYYFEVDEPCAVYLEQVLPDGVALRLAEHRVTAPRRAYAPVSGVIDADAHIPGAATRLRFLGGAPYNIRNVAFYAARFPDAGQVPPFARWDRYDLKALTQGMPGREFMELAPNNVVMCGERYARSDSFRWEGESVIVFDHYTTGQYDIYYHAYPSELIAPDPERGVAGTDAAFVPELSPEALDIVPLYMASRLFADDNAALSSQYLNRYMQRRSELSTRATPLGSDEILCETGWW